MFSIRRFSSHALARAVGVLKVYPKTKFSETNVYILYGKKLKERGGNDTHLSEILLEMLDRGIFPNTFCINQMIQATLKTHLNISIDLCEIAIQRKMANTVTYTLMIDGIAKSHLTDKTLAWSLFQDAKARSLVDHVTYSAIIGAIARDTKLNHTSLVLQVFEEAKSKYWDNLITHMNTLDALALAESRKDEIAFKVLSETISKFKLIDLSSDLSLLDLHGLSYGVVYFGLKKRCVDARDKTVNQATTLICGKGLHSHSSLFNHPVKHAILKVVQETQGVYGYEDLSNSGRYHFFIRCHQPHYTQSSLKLGQPVSEANRPQ